MYLASEVLPKWGTVEGSAIEAGLDEFESIYAFILSRVGNRPDAEDLTQEVALKALPRLRDGAPPPAVRAYLYATARSVLATFWSKRLRLPESELPDDLRGDSQASEVLPSAGQEANVARILDSLSSAHRRVIELRFLQGLSLREVASEMGKSVGSVKLMQLRALRRAAHVGLSNQPRSCGGEG